MLKPYQNHIKLIHEDYSIHVKAIYVPNVAYILLISVPYIIQIKAIFEFFGRNVDYFDLRGGGSEFFTFFPNSNNRNMTLTFMIYGTDIGEIYATFGTYMAYT